MLKEYHLVQRAEFAVVQGIDIKPAFNWWVKHVCKKRDRIIASVRKQQTRYLHKSHKFGIELPEAVEQAYARNTLWADALCKEMDNIRVAFKVLPDGKSVSIGHIFV